MPSVTEFLDALETDQPKRSASAFLDGLEPSAQKPQRTAAEIMGSGGIRSPMGTDFSADQNIGPAALSAVNQLGDVPLVPAKAIRPAMIWPLAADAAVNLFPESDVAKYAAGAGTGISEAISGFTTPKNAALVAATGGLGTGTALAKTGQAAIMAAFEAQAVQAFPEQYKAYRETTDPAEKARLVTGILVGLGLPVVGTVHSAFSKEGKVKPVEEIQKEKVQQVGQGPEVLAPEQGVFTPLADGTFAAEFPNRKAAQQWVSENSHNLAMNRIVSVGGKTTVTIRPKEAAVPTQPAAPEVQPSAPLTYQPFADLQTREPTNAITQPEATGLPQREVRSQVGESTSLREQRKAPEASAPQEAQVIEPTATGGTGAPETPGRSPESGTAALGEGAATIGGTEQRPLGAGIDVTPPKPPVIPPEDLPYTGDGGRSKIGQSIEAKAVEAKLTTGFADTAGYDPITIKEQAQRATDLIKSSVRDARNIIRGDAMLPDGVRGTALITAMEEHLTRHPDAQVAYELANSPLTSATSAAAQEMRLMAERVPDGITAKFNEIREARKAGAKLRGETPDRVAKEVTREIVKNSSKRPTWESFVRSIECV